MELARRCRKQVRAEDAQEEVGIRDAEVAAADELLLGLTSRNLEKLGPWALFVSESLVRSCL